MSEGGTPKSLGTTKRQVPIKGGLFHLPSSPEEKGYLVGSRCRQCEEVFFPRRHFCALCCTPSTEDVPLSTQGKLYSYTIVHQKLPGSLLEPPYALGMVQLPEGPLFTAVLATQDFGRLELDMLVELVFEVLKQDAQGNDIVGFMFRPLQEQAGP